MDIHPPLVIFLILVAAIVAIELRISVAIVEITAGVIASVFFANQDLSWIELPAMFGIIGLMFFAGFETNEELLRRYWKQSLLIGSVSYFAPFTLVMLTARIVFRFSMSASLLVAIGLSTTSLAVVYSVLRDKRAIDRKWGQILLSSAMVVDVLSMISLTVLFEGVRLWEILLLVPLFISLFSLSRLGRRIFARYRGDTVEFETRFILVVLLGLALVSETIRIHVAVLAFVTGIIFSELMTEHGALEEKLKSLIFGFMAPLFFFRAGLSIDLAVIRRTTLGIILSLGTIAFTAKYFATYGIIRRRLREPIARLGGLLFNFRLTFAIIVATFGIERGVISPEIYTTLMSIVLASVLVVSVLLRQAPSEG